MLFAYYWFFFECVIIQLKIFKNILVIESDEFQIFWDIKTKIIAWINQWRPLESSQLVNYRLFDIRIAWYYNFYNPILNNFDIFNIHRINFEFLSDLLTFLLFLTNFGALSFLNHWHIHVTHFSFKLLLSLFFLDYFIINQIYREKPSEWLLLRRARFRIYWTFGRNKFP